MRLGWHEIFAFGPSLAPLQEVIKSHNRWFDCAIVNKRPAVKEAGAVPAQNPFRSGSLRLVMKLAVGCLALGMLVGCETLKLDSFRSSPAESPAPVAVATPTAPSGQFGAAPARTDNPRPVPPAPASVSTPAHQPTANPAPKPATIVPVVSPKQAAQSAPVQPLIIRSTAHAIPTEQHSVQPTQTVAQASSPPMTVAPPPPSALIFVGPKRAPVSDHPILRKVLWTFAVLFGLGLLSLTLPPVRARISLVRASFIIWFSKGNRGQQIKSRLEGFIESSRQKMKSRSSRDEVSTPEVHRPTPVELLLKKIGTQPPKEVSTSNGAGEKIVPLITEKVTVAPVAKAEQPSPPVPQGPANTSTPAAPAQPVNPAQPPAVPAQPAVVVAASAPQTKEPEKAPEKTEDKAVEKKPEPVTA